MVTTVDHTETAKALMLSEFDSSPVVREILSSWLQPVQGLEDDLQGFMAANGVSTASGVMLDIVGEWLGVYREGRVDSEYRLGILARGLLEGADGTTEKFLSGMRTLCRTTYVTFYEYFPATVYAVAGDGFNNSLIKEIRRIAPVGVHVRLLVDNQFDSMVPSEVVTIDNTLVTGGGDDYEVVVDAVTHLLTISAPLGEVLVTSGDEMAELFDTEWTPMAELVVIGYSTYNSYLLDSYGNFVVDNNNNRIIVTEIS